MPLDLRHAIVEEADHGFWPALVTVFSGSNSRETIYVLENDDDRRQAFLHVRRRLQQPDADLVYIAPKLEGTRMVEEVWRELLRGVCDELAQQGVERIYAGPPEFGMETQIFREAGFTLYSREDLFRLDEWPELPPGDAEIPLEVRSSVHDWGIERLYNDLVPWLVQQAEGSLWANEVGDGPLWHEAAGEYALVDGDEVVGVLRIKPSSKNHWFRIVLHPRGYHWARAAVAFGIRQLRAFPRRPVYCSVREYQGGLRGPLEDLGFRWIGSRSLVVRQTLARVRAQEPWPARAAMEKNPQTAVPTALPFHVEEGC